MKNTTQQADIELKRLETHVSDLLSTCQQLNDENQLLRQQHQTLTAERANLIQKNEQARSRVEAMINRLKSLESHL